MNLENQSYYPGDAAQVREMIALADEYRAAAMKLVELGRKGQPMSRAPARFCAIHAIELYLNATLMHRGMDTGKIRAHRHDLASRVILCGLALRKKTADHLQGLTANREYLVLRYGPEMTSTVSELNRLFASLDEVARKASKAVG